MTMRTALVLAAGDPPARHLTSSLELLLFGLALLLTVAVVSVFVFAVVRHANCDSQGRTPQPDDQETS